MFESCRAHHKPNHFRSIDGVGRWSDSQLDSQTRNDGVCLTCSFVFHLIDYMTRT
jgi:hypothetical protein